MPKDRSPHHMSSTRKENETNGVNQAPQVTGRHDIGSLRTALAGGVLLLLRQAEGHFGGCMAKIIDFYIPRRFRKAARWLPLNERGKLLEFPMAAQKSA